VFDGASVQEVLRDRFKAGVTSDAPLSPSVRAIITHLCEGECHTFGNVLEWCETRGDCQQAVVCPGCSHHFLVDDDELAELGRWTDSQGMALVCGVRWE
jgi:hypothetical protein